MEPEPKPTTSDPTSGVPAADGPVNARKRKKTSRACDFCHVNHQPCDNGDPRCSVCEKHNKPCLYLRPQKKRGPAKGYRSTLNSLNESAAAWGAALNLIPSLGPVIEGYLKNPEGQRLIRAIKDPKQQDFFIRSWQESGVFRAFFGGEGGLEDGGMGDGEGLEPLGFTPLPNADLSAIPPAIPPANPLAMPLPPLDTKLPQIPGPGKSPALTTVSSHSFPDPGQFKLVPTPHGPRPSISVSDIVARDAARSAQSAGQTLGPLGFAPNETFDDFHAMTSHPEPFPHMNPEEQGFDLGSELDQKAYYELVMGRQFHQPFG